MSKAIIRELEAKLEALQGQYKQLKEESKSRITHLETNAMTTWKEYQVLLDDNKQLKDVVLQLEQSLSNYVADNKRIRQQLNAKLALKTRVITERDDRIAELEEKIRQLNTYVAHLEPQADELLKYMSSLCEEDKP